MFLNSNLADIRKRKILIALFQNGIFYREQLRSLDLLERENIQDLFSKGIHDNIYFKEEIYVGYFWFIEYFDLLKYKDREIQKEAIQRYNIINVAETIKNSKFSIKDLDINSSYQNDYFLPRNSILSKVLKFDTKEQYSDNINKIKKSDQNTVFDEMIDLFNKDNFDSTMILNLINELKIRLNLDNDKKHQDLKRIIFEKFDLILFKLKILNSFHSISNF